MFTAKLANDLTKITMTEFFKNIHTQFYQDQDISFVKYFLELCEHEDEFYVHHSKLVEYGIMTSTRSSNAREKLDNLGLNEGPDYRLLDVQQPVKQGGYVTKKNYYLTPEAFKKCLMRAQRRPNQTVDPVVYCNYYLLLEKVFKLYTDYERQYSKKLLSMKDDKIDELIKEVKDQKKSIKNLTAINLDQTSKIKRLIEISEDLNEKFDTTFEFMIEIAKMTLCGLDQAFSKLSSRVC